VERRGRWVWALEYKRVVNHSAAQSYKQLLRQNLNVSSLTVLKHLHPPPPTLSETRRSKNQVLSVNAQNIPYSLFRIGDPNLVSLWHKAALKTFSLGSPVTCDILLKLSIAAEYLSQWIWSKDIILELHFCKTPFYRT